MRADPLDSFMQWSKILAPHLHAIKDSHPKQQQPQPDHMPAKELKPGDIVPKEPKPAEPIQKEQPPNGTLVPPGAAPVPKPSS